MAILFCMSGVALAAAAKVKLEAYGGLLPDASGHAVLNYAKGADKTIVQVNCWDLAPSTNYTVYLNDGSWYVVGTFTSDGSGEGHLHVSLSGNRAGDVPVAVNDTTLNATVLLGS